MPTGSLLQQPDPSLAIGSTDRVKALNLFQGYRGIHKGDRAFILGSGPSLKKIDSSAMGKLGDEYTFGLNLILRADLPFTPSALVVMVSEWHWVRDRGIEWMMEELGRTGKPLPSSKFYAHLRPVPEMDAGGWRWVKAHEGQLMTEESFAGLGPSWRSAAFGYSVDMTAVQIAAWMGFDPIYLVGVDATETGHAYSEDPVLDQRGEQSGHHASAKIAHHVLRSHGRTLLDLSPSGLLPIPKSSLSEVLG